MSVHTRAVLAADQPASLVEGIDTNAIIDMLDAAQTQINQAEIKQDDVDKIMEELQLVNRRLTKLHDYLEKHQNKLDELVVHGGAKEEEEQKGWWSGLWNAMKKMWDMTKDGVTWVWGKTSDACSWIWANKEHIREWMKFAMEVVKFIKFIKS